MPKTKRWATIHVAIKLLSFDLDDTLWPCLPTIQAAEKAHYDWLQQHVPALCQRYSIDQLRQHRLDFMARHPHWAHDLSRVRFESLRALSAELNIPDDWVEPAFQVFYRARQKVTLFDDVAPVLDRLARHYRLLALTNGNSDVVLTGIHHWFDFALNSIEAGAKKSEPLIYRQAAARADVLPGECIHIGDDPLQDVRGAQLAGFHTVWLNRDRSDWSQIDFQPDSQIHSLHELADVVAQIEAQQSPEPGG